ncbi:MAG: GNAT family N-acetyltransferase [Desulfobacterales bacterium]
MKTSVQYRLMQAGEEQEVCDLVIRVFNEFVAHQYSDIGIQEFLKYVQPHCLSERCQKDDFIVLAISQGKIVGMIELVENSHISLFYTEGERQRSGIGRKLLRKALEICVRYETTIKEITVNSSPNAVKIYEKLGFYVMKKEQLKNGIRFVPMRLEKSKSSD